MARVREFERWLGSLPYKRVAVVAHGDFIEALAGVDRLGTSLSLPPLSFFFVLLPLPCCADFIQVQSLNYTFTPLSLPLSLSLSSFSHIHLAQKTKLTH